MPSLALYSRAHRVPVAAPDGAFVMDAPTAGTSRVPLRRLTCLVQVPSVPGVREAILDTGAPLTILPFHLWSREYNWRPGRDYDELPVSGGPTVRSRLLHHQFDSRLVRIRVPLTLLGRTAGVQVRLDSVVAQLADANGPTAILLGLWGGVFDGRSLRVACDVQAAEVTGWLDFSTSQPV